MKIEWLFDRASETGRTLAAELAAAPAPVGFTPLVVNWTGSRKPEQIRGMKVLNHQSRTDKLAQLVWLEHQKVPIPAYSLRPVVGWLGRTLYHQQGKDFTRPPKQPDYWVQRVPTTGEWRLHVFKTAKGNYRILRSAQKVKKENQLRAPHPWVRSHRLGWKLSYTGGAPEILQKVARAAVAALQLDFGAVDIGVQANGDPVVFEVNTCPGLDTGTRKLYVDMIAARGVA